MITHYLERVDYADAYQIKTTRLKNAEEAAYEIFSDFPAWVNALLAVRNKIVTLFGLKTEAGPGAKLFFDSYFAGETESILGKDDKHLNFRVSILIEDEAQGCRNLWMTTAVQYNNKLGAVYFAFIKPFHEIIVNACLKNYAKKASI